MSMRAQGYAFVWLWVAIVAAGAVTIGATVYQSGVGQKIERLRADIDDLQRALQSFEGTGQP